MASDEVSEWLHDLSPDEMRRTVDALYRAHQLDAVIIDMKSVMRRIMEEGHQLAGSEACSLLLYDPPTDELYFYETVGDAGDQEALKKQVRLRMGEGIAGACAESLESIVVADAEKDERVFRDADTITNIKTKSLLAVPMMRDGELVGVIELVNKRDAESFTEADRRLLEVFASLAAGVILNARRIEENIRSERLAAVGQTVAGLSHYTKNILAGLHGSMELIDDGLQSDDLSLIRQAWDVLKRSAERLSMVIEDMLSYSKERTALLEDRDLRPVIDEICGSFQLLFKRKDVALEVDTIGLPPTVRIDAAGIHRVLLNLMNNAGAAIPDQSGRLLLRAYADDHGMLIMELHDNGKGVSRVDAPRIFDPFYSTKGSGGTGLGLAVTSKIVREHRGTIRVDSSPLGGALFRISIPQDKEAEDG